VPDDEVQIGFRGTPSYRKTLKREALDRGYPTVQAMLEDAVDTYLRGSPTGTSKCNNSIKSEDRFGIIGTESTQDYPADERRLLTILHSDVPGLAETVRSLLGHLARYAEVTARGGLADVPNSVEAEAENILERGRALGRSVDENRRSDRGTDHNPKNGKRQTRQRAG
jgi:hypothetical protein